jgi:lysophospholipase L1-like esterase
VRRAVERAVLLTGGFVVALVLLEGFLRLGALIVRPDVSASGAGARRVLAVGDSNVYGLYLPRADAYPAQLARLLPDTVVVNAGVPGMDSGRLRSLLPALLDEHRPTDVLITVGANDVWTPGTAVDVRQPWWTHLRLARLVAWLRWELQDPGLAVTPGRITVDMPPMLVGDRVVEVSTALGTGKQDPAVTRENLAALVAMIRERGARPWIVAYAADGPLYGPANAVLRAAGKDLGVPVIEEPLSGETMLFKDGHPTAAGYAAVARQVGARLAE